MMEINSDFTRRVTMHAGRLPWTPSPTAGVERRMLDRIGGEVARATSIVRYAAGSAFPQHTHGGGEEFLVLDGVFSDDGGDMPAGSYVRNPPGTAHAPRSTPGCTIFVKLWQFDPTDTRAVRRRVDDMELTPDEILPGVRAAPLHEDGRERVRLERWAPGTIAALDLPGGGEFLVLGGGFEEGGEHFARQSWLRLPARARLLVRAGPEGCRLWVKTGHLAGPIRAPAER